MMLLVEQYESKGLRRMRLGSNLTTIMGTALLASAALVLSWWGLRTLLAADRGLDLTDEGLYLLAADPPSPIATWGFPFGWHVRPLFELVGYDIASFRTLGAVILVASSAWLGFATSRASLGSATPDRTARITLVLITLSGALGSLLFYAPMLRTPSYNWSNLVGITIAIAAAITLVSPQSTNGAERRRWILTLAMAAIASIALFSTIPAKPSTLPMVLLLSTILLLIARGWRTAILWAVALVALLPAWLTLAFAVRLWPSQALDVFRLALDMPAPDPLQTTGAAVQAALLVPLDAVNVLLDAPTPILSVFALGLVLAVLPALVGRAWVPLRIIGFVVTAVGALAMAGLPVPGLQSLFEPFRIASANVTTACLVVLFAALTSSLPRGLQSDRATGANTAARWAIPIILAMLPFVFSFGSGNGIYAQASLACGFTLLAAVACMPRQHSWPTGVTPTFAAAAVVVAFAAGSVTSGWQGPFRAAPIADQTSITPVGAHGASLLLEPELSQTITTLRSEAEDAGWRDGTPVVDVSFMWNPAIAYALGGRVPDFLAFTIFGYPSAYDIADFHLSEPFRNFPFDETWFVTSRPASIADLKGQDAVNFTMDKLENVTGRLFPESYACIAAGDFILWRPEDNAQGTDVSCAN